MHIHFLCDRWSFCSELLYNFILLIVGNKFLNLLFICLRSGMHQKILMNHRITIRLLFDGRDLLAVKRKNLKNSQWWMVVILSLLMSHMPCHGVGERYRMHCALWNKSENKNYGACLVCAYHSSLGFQGYFCCNFMSNRFWTQKTTCIKMFSSLKKFFVLLELE
jgi:hypothetical protein